MSNICSTSASTTWKSAVCLNGSGGGHNIIADVNSTPNLRVPMNCLYRAVKKFWKRKKYKFLFFSLTHFFKVDSSH